MSSNSGELTPFETCSHAGTLVRENLSRKCIRDAPVDRDEVVLLASLTQVAIRKANLLHLGARSSILSYKLA